jgi:hypothetical protein
VGSAITPAAVWHPRARGTARASAAVGVLAVVLATLLGAGAAQAVLLASGDGTGNLSAPTDDPGFDHVGTRLPGNLSAVYLRNGWVLSAAHVGAGTVRLGGVDYAALAASARSLVHGGAVAPDLILFRLVDETGLAPLALRASVPALNASVTLAGNGFDRGAALSYGGHAGWGWLATRALRWGTNRVAQRGFDVTIGSATTRAFSTTFTVSGGTTSEAQAVVGDSGGAVFLKNGTAWELAGILFAIDAYEGQPANTSLDGNSSFAADLSYYRAQIEAIVDVPACSDGLDDDADGDVDWPADTGCRGADDASERYACEDQLDDDGDGLVDWPLDPGCAVVFADDESPQCQNGLDDDGDGLADAADPQCTKPWIGSEAPPKSCGLLGAEALLVLAAARALRRRR